MKKLIFTSILIVILAVASSQDNFTLDDNISPQENIGNSGYRSEIMGTSTMAYLIPQNMLVLILMLGKLQKK